MYTNAQNVNNNELVVVHYGNTVTIKGSQVIINGQPGPQLPHKVNDLLVRQATSILLSVEGNTHPHPQLHHHPLLHLQVPISPFISMVSAFISPWEHPLSTKRVVSAVPSTTWHVMIIKLRMVWSKRTWSLLPMLIKFLELAQHHRKSLRAACSPRYVLHHRPFVNNLSFRLERVGRSNPMSKLVERSSLRQLHHCTGSGVLHWILHSWSVFGHLQWLPINVQLLSRC